MKLIKFDSWIFIFLAACFFLSFAYIVQSVASPPQDVDTISQTVSLNDFAISFVHRHTFRIQSSAAESFSPLVNLKNAHPYHRFRLACNTLGCPDYQSPTDINVPLDITKNSGGITTTNQNNAVFTICPHSKCPSNLNRQDLILSLHVQDKIVNDGADKDNMILDNNHNNVPKEDKQKKGRKNSLQRLKDDVSNFQPSGSKKMRQENAQNKQSKEVLSEPGYHKSIQDLCDEYLKKINEADNQNNNNINSNVIQNNADTNSKAIRLIESIKAETQNHYKEYGEDEFFEIQNKKFYGDNTQKLHHNFDPNTGIFWKDPVAFLTQYDQIEEEINYRKAALGPNPDDKTWVEQKKIEELEKEIELLKAVNKFSANEDKVNELEKKLVTLKKKGEVQGVARDLTIRGTQERLVGCLCVKGKGQYIFSDESRNSKDKLSIPMVHVDVKGQIWDLVQVKTDKRREGTGNIQNILHQHGHDSYDGIWEYQRRMEDKHYKKIQLNMPKGEPNENIVQMATDLQYGHIDAANEINNDGYLDSADPVNVIRQKDAADLGLIHSNLYPQYQNAFQEAFKPKLDSSPAVNVVGQVMFATPEQVQVFKKSNELDITTRPPGYLPQPVPELFIKTGLDTNTRRDAGFETKRTHLLEYLRSKDQRTGKTVPLYRLEDVKRAKDKDGNTVPYSEEEKKALLKPHPQGIAMNHNSNNFVMQNWKQNENRGAIDKLNTAHWYEAKVGLGKRDMTNNRDENDISDQYKKISAEVFADVVKGVEFLQTTEKNNEINIQKELKGNQVEFSPEGVLLVLKVKYTTTELLWEIKKRENDKHDLTDIVKIRLQEEQAISQDLDDKLASLDQKQRKIWESIIERKIDSTKKNINLLKSYKPNK